MIEKRLGRRRTLETEQATSLNDHRFPCFSTIQLPGNKPMTLDLYCAIHKDIYTVVIDRNVCLVY